MKHRTAVILPDSIRHQLDRYALAASAAGVGMLALTQPLEAKIAYTKAHKPLYPNSYIGLDLNHDGKYDFAFSNFSAGTSPNYGWLWVLPNNSTNEVMGYHTSVGRWDASALRAGTKIKANTKFVQEVAFVMAGSYQHTASTSRRGPWVDVRNRYLGLKFGIQGKTHYGWARLNVSCAKGRCTGLLTGYAYETVANKGIIAGKTKGPDVITVQPATLGHLAAGASAIPAWRRADQ